MNLIIKATGIELTDSLRAYVASKMKALTKFVPREGMVASLEIGRTTEHHRHGDVFKAEINVEQPGERLIREVVMEQDLYTAIDVLQTKVSTKLSQHKDKSQYLLKRGARAVKHLLRGFGN